MFGVDGVRSQTTLWQVELDAVTDDPVKVFGTPGNGGVVLGQAYPHNGYGIVATHVIPRATDNSNIWEMEVLYGNPILFPGTEWQISARGAAEVRDEITAKNFETGEDEPIGPHMYVVASTITLPDPSLSDRPFFATIHDNGVAETKELRQFRDANKRRVKGISVTRAAAQIVYSATVSQLPKGVFNSAFRYLNTVNSQFFGGFDEGLVKCSEVAIDQRTGFIEGQPISGVVYEINLTFSIDMDGYQPIFQPDTWIDENGTEVPIFDDAGVPVITEYFPYRTRDHNQLLELFLPGRSNVIRAA